MHRTILAVIGVVSIGLLGACGDDSGTTTTPAATSPATTVAATTTTAAAVTTTTGAVATTAAAAGTVKLSDSRFGKILTDDAGRTLYMFTNDVKGKSNCAGACATNWPVYAPATISSGSTGIDASKLASIDNAGKKQLTIDGVPLYYFSGDAKAGDTNGQGVGGVWFVVDATGKAIK